MSAWFPPPLPYRWTPDGARGGRPLEPGVLVAIRHTVWRVVALHEINPVDWSEDDHKLVAWHKAHHFRRVRPLVVVLRPAHLTGEDPRDRDHDVSVTVGVGIGRADGLGHGLDVYPGEHYPVCARCQEPTPCREVMVARLTEAAGKRMARYEVAGVCPSCAEVVTARQESLTFLENLMVPAGPPVTFHLRRGCYGGALTYEKAWAAADPQRRCRLSCPGHVTNHNDGTYECTEFGLCPGPTAEHRSYAVCRCPDCHARGSFGCGPARDATLLDRRTP